MKIGNWDLPDITTKPVLSEAEVISKIKGLPEKEANKLLTELLVESQPVFLVSAKTLELRKVYYWYFNKNLGFVFDEAPLNYDDIPFLSPTASTSSLSECLLKGKKGDTSHYFFLDEVSARNEIKRILETKISEENERIKEIERSRQHDALGALGIHIETSGLVWMRPNDLTCIVGSELDISVVITVDVESNNPYSIALRNESDCTLKTILETASVEQVIEVTKLLFEAIKVELGMPSSYGLREPE